MTLGFVISTSLYWLAVFFTGVALLTGSQNAERIYMPHEGYTWGALAILLFSIGLK